jgi:hypothetical protein
MGLTPEQLTGIVRAVLAAAGGGAVFSADLLTQVAGALVTLGVAIWSVWSKKKPS